MPSRRLPDPASLRGLIIYGAVFAFIGLVVFGAALGFGFVSFDDPLLVLQNPDVQWLSFASIGHVFAHFDPELYVPLTFLSYQWDQLIGGGSAFPFHLGNLLLHVLNAGLVTLLLRRLFQWKWIAVLCGLIFLIHPLQTETVAWVSARKDVLASFFFLASLLSYVEYARGDHHSRRFYIIAVMCFVLALLSKVIAITLPVVLFLVDDLQGRPITRKTLIDKAPFIGLAIVFGIVALFGKGGVAAVPVTVSLLLGIRSVTFYLQKFVWPAALSVLYPVGSIGVSSPAFVLSLLFIVALGVGAFLLRCRSRVPFFVFLFYFITLAPTFFNLPKGGVHYLASDRYAYIPLIGILILIGSCVQHLSGWIEKRGSQVFAAVGVVIASLWLIAFGMIAHAQTFVWKDSETLYRHVLSLYPNAVLAHINLGIELRDKGDVDGALTEFDAAQTVGGPSAQIFYNRALALEQKRDLNGAAAAYREAITLDPSYALADINLGRLLYAAGKREEAKAAFQAAAKADPSIAMASFNLAVMAAEEGNVDEAVRGYKIALERDPLFLDARLNLIALLLKYQRVNDAVRELQFALDQAGGEPRVQALLKYMQQQGLVSVEGR